MLTDRGWRASKTIVGLERGRKTSDAHLDLWPGVPSRIVFHRPLPVMVVTAGFTPRFGRLAQLVARFLHTEEVISSSLVSPTRCENCLSRSSERIPLRRASRCRFRPIHLHCALGSPLTFQWSTQSRRRARMSTAAPQHCPAPALRVARRFR